MDREDAGEAQAHDEGAARGVLGSRGVEGRMRYAIWWLRAAGSSSTAVCALGGFRHGCDGLLALDATKEGEGPGSGDEHLRRVTKGDG